MKEITLPDGRTASFPDDMPNDQIAQILRRQFPPKNPIVGRDSPHNFANVPTPQGISGLESAQALGRGAGMGFADEIAGGAFAGAQGLLNAASGRPVGDLGKTYTGVRDAARAQASQTRQEHPGASIALEMGGAAFPAAVAGAAPAVAQAASALRAAPVATRLGAAAGGGAGVGAIVGAGEAETMAEVPETAARGALWGGLLGPAFEGLASGVQAMKRPLSSQRSAERRMRRTMARGKMDPREVRKAIKDAGPTAVLADAGESFLSELDGIVNTPGAGREVALKRLYDRVETTLGEILDATGPGNYFQNLERAKNVRQQFSSKLYESAYARPLPDSDLLDDLFLYLKNDGTWDGAAKKGMVELSNAGVPFKQAAVLRADGKPTLRGWNAVKMQLDDKIGSAKQAGEFQDAALYYKRKRKLVEELDELTADPATGIPIIDKDFGSDYKAARRLHAGTKEFENAQEEGMKFMTGSKFSALVDNFYGGLNPWEKMGYREGARQSIQNLLENAGDTHDLTKFFKKPAVRKKIATVFEDKAPEIMKTINGAATRYRTLNRVRGNSLTAMRIAQQDEQRFGAELAGLLADTVISPASTSTNMLRMLSGKARQKVGPRQDTREIMAEMLTSPDIPSVMRAMSGGGMPMPTTGAGLLSPAVGGVGGGILGAGPPMLPDEFQSKP